MPEVTVDGIKMMVPDGIATENLLDRCGVKDARLIRRTSGGMVELLDNGQHVQLRDGDQLATLPRFRAGYIYKIDGVDIDIPDGATTEKVLADLGKAAMYEIYPDGRQKILEGSEVLDPYGGRRLGTLSRFKAA